MCVRRGFARTRGVFNYMWVNRVYIAGVGVHVMKSFIARCSCPCSDL